MTKRKRCFIITPIGSENSETREKAEGVIEAIAPVIEEFDFSLDIPHRMPKPGSITQQILECILNNDLVIANLTELNPNVMYELAVRHASAKPVVTIAENGTKLPFDITTERAIFYSNDMRGVPKLQRDLRTTIQAINFNSVEHDNPIYRAQRDFKFKETIIEGKDAYILEQLEGLKITQQEQFNLLKSIGDNYIENTIYRNLYAQNVDSRPSSQRIIKLSKDLNVGIGVMVDFLKTKNIEIEANPNTKISKEMALILISEFGTSEDLNKWLVR